MAFIESIPRRNECSSEGIAGTVVCMSRVSNHSNQRAKRHDEIQRGVLEHLIEMRCAQHLKITSAFRTAEASS